MIIKVTEKGFVWVLPTGEKQVTEQLWGPSHCRFEELKVIRDGNVIDEATIRTIGTHRSYEGFEGLEQIANGRSYHQTLGLDLFQIGDELHIDTLTANMPAFHYWLELTLGKATELAA